MSSFLLIRESGVPPSEAKGPADLMAPASCGRHRQARAAHVTAKDLHVGCRAVTKKQLGCAPFVPATGLVRTRAPSVMPGLSTANAGCNNSGASKRANDQDPEIAKLACCLRRPCSGTSQGRWFQGAAVRVATRARTRTGWRRRRVTTPAPARVQATSQRLKRIGTHVHLWPSASSFSAPCRLS